MSVGRLTSVLGPFFTDADWSQDFCFYVGDGSTEQSWSGVQGTISFVRQGLPKARFTLSSAAGSLVVLGNGLGIRLPAAEMAKRVPGTYDFELRRIEPDGDTIALLVGQVAISAGLSTESPPLPGGGGGGGSGGPVLVTINNGSTTTTLAPTGPAGASARDAAIAAGALPTGATDADFLDYLREPAVEASEALLGETEGARDTAVAARDTAVEAAGTATDAAGTATMKAAEADAGATAAAAARDLALSYRDGAVAARDLTLDHRDTALAARDVAEDHRDAAQLYRDQSQAAAAAVVTDKYSRVGSTVDAEGFDFPASVKAIATAGYLAAGDGGHALYKRVAAQPAHLGRLRSVDRYRPDGTVDAANGGWWEIVDLELNARAFGAKGDGVTDDHVALQAMLDAMILLGRPGRVPSGDYRILTALRVNTTGNVDTAVIGFKLAGDGMARFDGGVPQYSAGTYIRYAGPATDAILKFERSFGRNFIVEDMTLAGMTPPTISPSGLTNIYMLEVQNGIKFADTSFSFATISRLGFYQVQRCVGVYKVTASNGENVTLDMCKGEAVGQAFYCDHNQAYHHHIRDSVFGCYPNNAIVEAADSSANGIGISIHSLSGGFYPADGNATNTLVKYQGGSTMVWIGGRIENVTQIITNTRGTSTTGGPMAFDSVEMTIPQGVGELKFVVLGGDSNPSPITISNCHINTSGTKRDLVIYAPIARGCIKFDRTIFNHVRNVIPYRGSTYATRIEFDACMIDGQPASGVSGGMLVKASNHGIDYDLPSTLGLTSALMGSGVRQNFLLESAMGLSSTVGNSLTNYVPPTPWVVSGNNGLLPQAGRWPNGFSAQPLESAFFVVLAPGQKLEQPLPHVTISGASALRYRAVIFLNELSGAANAEDKPFRFAMVDNTDPTIVYDEARYRPAGGQSIPMLLELKRSFNGSSGAPRLVIENNHDGEVRLTMLWQHVATRRGPVTFVSTTSAAVSGATDWSAIGDMVAVRSRFQLPYKDDAFGTNGSLTELEEGETYHSKNDGRRVTRAQGKWKREPVFDSRTGAPSSGTYALGEVTMNSNPVAAGKAGWICVSAGSPGVHKPWGAIDG